jgi:uncharacterized cupin superfamily protein
MADQDVAFAALDRAGDERFQSLRTPLGVSSFGMNVIVLQRGQRGRIHAHEQQEEVYLVLEGELTLIVEGVEHRLGVDQLARVGPAVRRQLLNSGSQTLVLLALGGAGDHAPRDARAWLDWDDGGPGSPPQEVPTPEDLPLA